MEQPADKQDEGMKDAEIDDNNNNSEEEAVGIEFIEQKADDENAIDFRWLDIRGEDEEEIAKANLIKSYKRKPTKNFSKRVTRGLFDYYGIITKETKQKKEDLLYNKFEGIIFDIFFVKLYF